MSDPEDYRAASRARWEAAAAGWETRRSELQRAAEPVSAWLVEAVEPQPGQTILELAAGLGDTGFLAAERVRPGGRVITHRRRRGDARGGRPPGRGARARQRRAARHGGRVDRPRDRDASTPCSAAGATCCWPIPRPRCARRAASCGPGAAWRSPRGRAPSTTRGSPRPAPSSRPGARRPAGPGRRRGCSRSPGDGVIAELPARHGVRRRARRGGGHGLHRRLVRGLVGVPVRHVAVGLRGDGRRDARAARRGPRRRRPAAGPVDRRGRLAGDPRPHAGGAWPAG